MTLHKNNIKEGCVYIEYDKYKELEKDRDFWKAKAEMWCNKHYELWVETMIRKNNERNKTN